MLCTKIRNGRPQTVRRPFPDNRWQKWVGLGDISQAVSRQWVSAAEQPIHGLTGLFPRSAPAEDRTLQSDDRYFICASFVFHRRLGFPNLPCHWLVYCWSIVGWNLAENFVMAASTFVCQVWNRTRDQFKATTGNITYLTLRWLSTVRLGTWLFPGRFSQWMD